MSQSSSDVLSAVVARVRRFEKDAHDILGVHESAPSRKYTLDKSYSKLSALSVLQDDLLRQSLRCVESGLFRAAHVMAWAALMDFVEHEIESHGLSNLATIRPKWKTSSLDDLREEVSEYQLVEAAKALELITKNQMKALHGLLAKRNECAHPSDYYPDFNQTLGFVAEVIHRFELLQKRFKSIGKP